MIQEAIRKLSKDQNLSVTEAEQTFIEIFEKKATPAQIAAFLVGLAIKKETEEEIYAAAKVIRGRALKIKVRDDFLGIEVQEEPIIDTCGTGGSGLNKFNISTATAFVVASTGIKVAKHGNRAMSSRGGSADVLEALGIKIEAPVTVMERAIKEVGIGFLFAPLYHPALKEVAQIRRELGIRTIFNILGPLCNPASLTHQLLGVYSEELLRPMANVLRRLGLKKACVVHSKDLKDEASLSSSTEVLFVDGTKIEKLLLTPSLFGLKRVKLNDLLVQNTSESSAMILNILKGKKGAPRDVVLANASLCLYIIGKVKNLKEGVRFAAQLIDEGKAEKKFLDFKEFVTGHI